MSQTRHAEPDPAKILAALGAGDATVVARAHGGADTLIWRVERAGVAYALRVFRPEQAATCQREAVAMGAAAAGGIPVPRVHAHGSWEDRPALLLSWCPGRPLLSGLRARPWRFWRLGVRFGRMQAAIHAVPAPRELRGQAADWIGWADPDASLEKRLRGLGPRGDALLHLDYHPLNVLAHGGRITAVLDWANARAGDPRADFARTITVLRLSPAPPGAQPAPPIARRLLELAWRSGFRQAAGPMGDLAPFHAWAGALMLRDLAPRLRERGGWLDSRDLEPVRRWTAAWRRRSEISS